MLPPIPTENLRMSPVKSPVSSETQPMAVAIPVSLLQNKSPGFWARTEEGNKRKVVMRARRIK